MKLLSYQIILPLLLVSAVLALAQRPYKTLDEIERGEIPKTSLLFQTDDQAVRKSSGCTSAKCHVNAESMHQSASVRLGCTDCHGGNPDSVIKSEAHVLPQNKTVFASSANPPRAYTAWLREKAEFVRFVNPGDLRVLDQTCGSAGCHERISYKVRKSMMTYGGMLWGAAAYNNGAYPIKDTAFGESYAMDGSTLAVNTVPPPTEDEIRRLGVLRGIGPLLPWPISRPGNVLRVFERGALRTPDVGNPDLLDEPGKPDKNLSTRGFGTGTRTDPVFLGLQKTRLLDPLLYFPGTNDQPGDYRASGCTGCHVIYANDSDPEHSGPYAQYGHDGRRGDSEHDPIVYNAVKDESGHPIRHRLTRAIPSSQCMVCHMHPGTNMEATYYGYTWWDNETDGSVMYPPKEKKLSAAEVDRIQNANPEGSALKGLWSDPRFLANVANLNPSLKQTQFADFHSHGWVFRAVYKRDPKGNLLNKDTGQPIPFDAPDKFQSATHLKDIHLEKGMHCIDCHFEQDVHGDGRLYNEPRASVAIDCADCHGTALNRPKLQTTGFASRTGSMNLAALRTPWGRRRFEIRGDKLIQRSMVFENKEWEIAQTSGADVKSEESRQAVYAHTVQKLGPNGELNWGQNVDDSQLAHPNSKMTCFACHSSWMTSCFGCHLSMTANKKKPALHYEGDVTKNWTSYNFQVLRDDVFMLAVDGSVTGHRIAPARSSSAIVVSSQTGNREWVYQTQQTVSAEGFSGQAFSTHVPHTVRTKETKTCSDCHLSSAGDNNAVMAQLMMLGTNFVNFMGRYIYVGEGRAGFQAVTVAERDEPQAIIGSSLHKLAYPTNFRNHEANKRQLTEAYDHGGDNIRSLQMRGEYLYAANGPSGLEIYDVAQIDNKGSSERIVTAPVSPLGQRFYVRTKDATAVAAPSTLAVDPVRVRRPENEEQAIAPLYGYIYVTDRVEGLILVGAGTLLDGDPSNNFLSRALTFNPNGLLNGANNITLAGNYAYITCDRGLVVLNLADPLKPREVSTIGQPVLDHPAAVAIQFRYAFVVDAQGMKAIDITNPEKPRPLPESAFKSEGIRDIYVARTYAYLAAGKNGLIIVDIQKPEQPREFLRYNADGAIDDAYSVKLAMTNASLFAYVADGKNGLRVLQMTSPETSPDNYVFSPEPRPHLIATYRTRGPAIALSKGLDRDRAVDESGNQLAVFGRRGARPFTLEEMRRLFLTGPDRRLYLVSDTPPARGSVILTTWGTQLKKLWQQVFNSF
jgi:hypothetical protein